MEAALSTMCISREMFFLGINHVVLNIKTYCICDLKHCRSYTLEELTKKYSAITIVKNMVTVRFNELIPKIVIMCT